MTAMLSPEDACEMIQEVRDFKRLQIEDRDLEDIQAMLHELRRRRKVDDG